MYTKMFTGKQYVFFLYTKTFTCTQCCTHIDTAGCIQLCVHVYKMKTCFLFEHNLCLIDAHMNLL
jgi:hypothetical protein